MGRRATRARATGGGAARAPAPGRSDRRSEVLVVRESPLPRAFRVALVSSLLSVSYLAVLDLGAVHAGADLLAHLSATLERPLGLLYAAAPLLLVPDLVLNLRALGTRRRLVFDARLRSVRQDGRHLAAFCDIECLAVETRPGRSRRRQPRYVLSARLPGGQGFAVRESERPEPVHALAGRLALLIGVPVVR